jgi:toxoflavin biosynthesis protein ToxD
MVTRNMVSIPATTVRVGLTPDEADRLALELAKMEERGHEPGLGGFDVVDLDAVRARRREWLEAAMPAHDVAIGAFEIDVYPVTNGEWARFVADTGARPAEKFGDGPSKAFVTGVSWHEAMAFAAAHELDLPSEVEWELAARNGRSLFTWGDSFAPQGEIAFRPPVNQPYKVGTRPETASKRGVHDLLGQFGEYCKDDFAPYPGADSALWAKHFPSARGQRVVRGGYDLNQAATCVSRRGVPPDERRTHLKFRCVRR